MVNENTVLVFGKLPVRNNMEKLLEMLARPYLTLAKPYLQKALILSFLSRELFRIFLN